MMFFRVLEYIGTASFSVSAVLVAIKYRLDLFGVVVLALTTALGGSIIRDVILNISPPTAFINVNYFAISFISATLMILFIKIVAKSSSILSIARSSKIFNSMLVFFDAVGLGIFTISGTRISVNYMHGNNYFLCIFVGVLTGVGGGILRDVFVNRRPIILRKEIYALASIVGSLVFCVFYNTIPYAICLYGCTFLIIAIRLIAAYKKVDLPFIKVRS